MRILVAMSGGIDSSVTAHLLKEQGHDLLGVRFTLWNDPLAPALAKVLPSKCCNAQTAARAKSVAEKLGIPYRIVDLEEEFKREVVDPFLEAHKKGLTPNPCIRCNRTIKFGKLLEIADALGCEKIATGHYARVVTRENPHPTSHIPNNERPTHYRLFEAIDKSKDQSYYLYGLTQEQLARAMFPLGTMHKRDVYALAEHYGIPYERTSYRESQDLCFFPEKTPKAFLRRHLKRHLQPGNIVRRDGAIIGTHEGVPLYTIGQRHGLRLGGLRVPLEVVAKRVRERTLVVAEKGAEQCTAVAVSALHWIAPHPSEREPIPFTCRTRSLAPLVTGSLTYRGTEGTFSFDLPQPLHTPGQHLVLYRGEEVKGGGIMAEP